MDDTILSFALPKERPSIIKVIGVGGGGGNAVTHMYKEGIKDVTFVLCNTDNQALIKSEVPVKVQLGKMTTEGLGAGNKPSVAKEAAEESIEDLKKLLNDGTKMVFVTAGMGGGTGTGAAPIISKVAKDMDILTIGIVTIPFIFEGKKKILQALTGVEEISKNVDALLVINNERLRDIYADLTLVNAFKKADDTLTIAAKSIAEIITLPGHVNLDFADVNTILKAGGVAIMSSGMGEGENRVASAIENALHSPLLNNNDVFKAKKILLNVSFSEEHPLMMEEMNDVHDFMAKFGSDIEVIWGAAVDEQLGDKVKVTVLATGFEIDHIPMMADKKRIDREKLSQEERRKMEEAEVKEHEEDERIKQYYGLEGFRELVKTTSAKPFIFTVEQMDDDMIIEAVINHPAYNRDPKVLSRLVADKKAQFATSSEEPTPDQEDGGSNDEESEDKSQRIIQF